MTVENANRELEVMKRVASTPSPVVVQHDDLMRKVFETMKAEPEG